jgi:Cu(I)/Ag(I) efflux system membrane protein CusA/SilA
MKRIAAPIVGGVFSSFLLELLVYPGIYEIWKWHFRRAERTGSEESSLILEPAIR